MSNPFWRETKRLGDGSNSRVSPRQNEGNKADTSPRSPLASLALPPKRQVPDMAENSELNEPRFSQWNPQNCFVLSCLKRKVYSWFIDSTIKAYIQGGYTTVLKFYGSREGILCLEMLGSLTTRDCFVDGCPDIAILLSKLVKAFLDMPSHDVSKTLSLFTNHASQTLRAEAAARNTVLCRTDPGNNSNSNNDDNTYNNDTYDNNNNDIDENDNNDNDELFYPSAALIDIFNKKSSLLAQAELYADRPEGAMPWRKLPKVFSEIIGSLRQRLNTSTELISTGTGDSPLLISSSTSTLSPSPPAPAPAQALPQQQQPPPILLQRRTSRAPPPLALGHYHFHYNQPQQVPTSLFGSICTHMLNVLEKLLFGQSTLRGFLSRQNAVDPLVQVLRMDYAKAGSELYVVHRQLVRTFGSLLVGSSQTVDGIVLLGEHRVIESFVDVLRRDSLPVGVQMEVIQLVAQILCMSSRLCNALVVAFRECGGYDVLLDFFLSKECSEGPLEKSRLVKLLCHFLFVMPSPQHTGTAACSSFDELVVVENFDGVKLVLDVFVRTTDEELRTELLIAIRSIFTLQTRSNARVKGSRWIRRQEANPFIALLTKFDELSLVNKRQILPIFDDVIVASGLSAEELKCYCAKLSQDRSPSTIILFQMHIARLLENGHLLRGQLESAGILDVLASYFVRPGDLKCAALLEDPHELSMALELIEEEDEDGCDSEEDEIMFDKSVSDKEASVRRVLRWISVCSFKLLTAIIRNNEDIERKLMDRDDFKNLFALLYTPDLRDEALRIITILATRFPEPKSGGFLSILSVLGCFRGQRIEHNTLASRFIVTLARVLRAALKGSLENNNSPKKKAFFRTQFTAILKICFENCLACDLDELIDIVMSICVLGSWPPPAPCPRKGCDLGAKTPCSECALSMTLEVPEVIQVMLLDLQDIIAAKDPAAQQRVLEKVRTLVTFSPDNLETLSHAGVHNSMLSAIGDRLIQRTIDGSGDRITELLLDILMAVLAQNVSGRNVKYLLNELKRTGYSPVVTALLQRLADNPQSPSTSLLLSCKSGVVGVESKMLRSRQWPPRQFTASMWVCVKSYGKEGRIELFSFQTPSRGGQLCAYLNPQGTLTFQAAPPSSSFPLSEGGDDMDAQGSVTFTKVRITENVWHNIVIGYSTSPQQQQQSSHQQQQQQQQQSSSLSLQQQQQQQSPLDGATGKLMDPHGACAVDLYVDGKFAERATISLPLAEETPIKLVVGASKQESDVSIGSSSSNFCCQGIKVSSMYYFCAAPSPMDILLMHSFKSGYWGNMAMDFSSFKHSITAAGPPSADVKSLLLRPGAASLETLTRNMVAAFVPRKMLIIDHDVLNAGSPVLLCTPSGATVSPTPQLLAPVVRSNWNIREVLNEIGGIQIVLFMIGTAATDAQQYSALRFLVSLLKDSPSNYQQMRACKGYKLLARVMSKPSWTLNRGVLDLAFELVGVTRTQGSDAYDAGMVLDVDALQCLIFDWHIWSRAPDALKEDLFQGLSSLITVNNASGFNLSRLTHCNIVTELMHIIQRPDTTMRIVRAVVSLIKEVIDASSVRKNDVQAIANFLFATHKVEEEEGGPTNAGMKAAAVKQDATKREKEKERAVHFPLLTTSMIGGTLSPQRMRSKSVSVSKSPLKGHTSGLAKNTTEKKKRWAGAEEMGDGGQQQHHQHKSKRKDPGDDLLIQKRVLVLEMLHDILSRVNYAAKESFVEAFPLEVTLAMLQHSTLALRVPLLILLGLCLQNDSAGSAMGKYPHKTGRSAAAGGTAPRTGKGFLRMSQDSPSSLPEKGALTMSSPTPSSSTVGSRSLYSRFVGLGGFDLLGIQLQSYSASAELYHTLFRLLVGSHFPKEFKSEANLSGNGLSMAVAEAEAALLSGGESSGSSGAAAGGGGGDSGERGGSGSGGSGSGSASTSSGQGTSSGGGDDVEKFALARPEVLKAIIRVAASPHAKYREQHSVIRGLHQICTISESSMQELIQNGLAKGLFSILCARIKERSSRGLLATGNTRGRMRNGSIGTEPEKGVLGIFRPTRKPVADTLKSSVTLVTPADDTPDDESDDFLKRRPKDEDDDDYDNEEDEEEESEGDDDDDENTENDEDIILFVKTIILNTTREEYIGKNITEILLALRTAGLPVDVMLVLQERILHDVFKVFTENPGFYNSPYLVTKFTALAEVAIEFIRWEMSPIDDANAAFPSRGYLRITGTRQDKAVLMILVLLVNILSKSSSSLPERVVKTIPKISELTWRVLLYALRDNTHTSELCAIALSAAREAYVLTTCPQVGRTYAIMFHATRFYESTLLEDAARSAVAEIQRLGPRPNTLLLSLTPGHYRLDSEAARNICATVRDMLRLPAECGEALSVHTAYVEETLGWIAQEARRASEFQAAQQEAACEARSQQSALHASIAERRLFIAEAARKVQRRAEDRPQLEVSRQRQADAALTHAAWKAIFRSVTHGRAVFALEIRTPFRRLGVDPTVDERWQRLRLHWETSDPQEETLNPPFSAVGIDNQNDALWALVVQHVKDQEFYRLDGSDASSEPLPPDRYPVVADVTPPYENGTLGGARVRIRGANIFPDDPNLVVYIGGVVCDIVGGTGGSEVVVQSPPQRDPGFYCVLVTYDGYFRKSTSKYGYLEMDLFRQYLAAKGAIPLDPDAPVLPVQILCGTPKKDEEKEKEEEEERRRKRSGVAAMKKEHIAKSPAEDGENGGVGISEVETEKGPVVFKERYAEVLDCTWITAFSERQGKVCTNRERLAFFAEGSVVGASRKYAWRFEDISEIYGRRHLLRDVAIELFFTTGKTCLFAFADRGTRDRFWNIIHKANLPNLLACDTVEDLRGGLLTNSLTDRWAFGQISNYEYLMRLNVLAGRTFNDLNQYPVFPWVIADYTSERLDLSDPKTFRDLSKPMGAQSEQRAAKFVSKYEQLEELGEVPYHYGTHYSSSGAVLHYMSRLEPYASYHVAFQGGRFDVPDRLFYDVGVAWNLSSSAALGDVKELIPEFYTLPEMFENRNNFDFGVRQDGSRVYDVRLPPWAKGSPREFVRLNRAALECEYVSAHLHEWIDLIFGCKQQSREALNVFHPYTCEGGVDWDAIEDPVDRLAKQTQVNTWGQTPRKLFTKPHPRRNIRALQQIAASVPAYTTPFAAHFVTKIASSVGEISIVNGMPTFYGARRIPLYSGEHSRKPSASINNAPAATSGDSSGAKSADNGGGGNSGSNSSGSISANSNSISIGNIDDAEGSAATEISRTTTARDDITADMFGDTGSGGSGGGGSSGNGKRGGGSDEYITWGHWDNSVHLVLGDAKGMVVSTGDTITAAGSSSSGHCVACGSSGGVVIAWRRRDPRTPALLGRATRLYGHTAPITAVFVSSEYNIIVSGSKDSTCIVWDISKMTYVRTLQHNHPIVAVCVSPTTGYIYTIERPVESDAATINMWSVNGDQIKYASVPGANCVQVTANTPGVKNNFVAVGKIDGSIMLLSANTLNGVSVLTRDPSNIPLSPITSIAFS